MKVPLGLRLPAEQIAAKLAPAFASCADNTANPGVLESQLKTASCPEREYFL